MAFGPVQFEVQEAPATVVIVTGADGQKYVMRLAMMIPAVVDTGIVNPLDQVPVFNVPVQVAVQITRKTDG